MTHFCPLDNLELAEPSRLWFAFDVFHQTSLQRRGVYTSWLEGSRGWGDQRETL